MKILFFGCLYTFILALAFAYPEQGKWSFNLQNSLPQSVLVSKSIFKGGKINFKISCNTTTDDPIKLKVHWYLRKVPCWNEHVQQGPIHADADSIFKKLESFNQSKNNSDKASVYVSMQEVIECDDKGQYLRFNGEGLHTDGDHKDVTFATTTEKLAHNSNTLPTTETPIQDVPLPIIVRQIVPLHTVQADGVYQFLVDVNTISLLQNNLSILIQIDIHSDYGYLSAADYPLLVFYAVMCSVYVIYGIGWLVVCFLRWRELLRVQYWIGAVILLGMLEKAVFTGYYEDVNKQGVNLPSILIFAEVVSCLKRTLSRMLVIIVSFGFGIVKPRLGVVLHRVIAVGLLYFVVSTMEACTRVLQYKRMEDGGAKSIQFAGIALAVLESIICWWVFSALMNTTRTLKLRRNNTKLLLYKHFTNTLAFVVIISLIFMLWVIRYQHMDSCLKDWKQLWVVIAFWHVLFALILLVIMVLWRPTNNNQRFAFSPLLDEASEEEEEYEKLVAADVSDTMKLRSTRNSASSPRQSRSVEDDLQWLEENIPSAIVDSSMPAVIDSDEEIIITKFEMSKMQ